MSDDQKPNQLQTIEEPKTDLTSKDLEVVNEYMMAGMPGLMTIDDVKLARIMDMYLSGKTYRQIAMTMSVQKQVILYLSHKFNWFQLRQDYLEDLEANIRSRVLAAKIVNQDFLLQLQQMWQKKIGSKIDKYLATGNEDFANEIDLKEVDKYMKSIETMQKLNSEKIPGQQAPAVGLNLGDGVTITKTGDNAVEITPKSKAIGDMLSQYANLRREEEKKPQK